MRSENTLLWYCERLDSFATTVLLGTAAANEQVAAMIAADVVTKQTTDDAKWSPPYRRKIATCVLNDNRRVGETLNYCDKRQNGPLFTFLLYFISLYCFL